MESAVVHLAAVTARAAHWESPASEPVPEYDPAAIEMAALDPEAIDIIMSAVEDDVVESLSVLLP